MTGFGYNVHAFGSYPNRRSWRIIMHTDSQKSNWGGNVNNTTLTQRQAAFGNPGGSTWSGITTSSTGAVNRNAFGDGVGLYDAFFTQAGITHFALVDGTGSLGDPTSNNNYRVYTLHHACTNNIYATLKDIDTRMKANVWANNDTIFGTNSSDDPVAGTATSGVLTASGGTSTSMNDKDNDPNVNSFCIWGINRDSDNDTQVLCSYSGNLQTGKGDAWRGQNPSETHWSYWGNDFHSSSAAQTISMSTQTKPGLSDSVQGANTFPIYLIAFG